MGDIFQASKMGRRDEVEILLNSGIDANVKDENGNTPLHYAAINNYVLLSQLLLDYGADPRIDNQAGQTPYGLAKLVRNEELEDLLNRYWETFDDRFQPAVYDPSTRRYSIPSTRRYSGWYSNI